MQIINVMQGTPEWHQHRHGMNNASEASAVMNESKYTTRTELVQRRATGIEPEVSPQTRALFDRGHKAEAAARKYVEQMIGEELFPTVGVSDEYPNMSASFDGITMDDSTLFECKLWNESLAAQVRAGELEPHYYWQLEHQLMVSGAERVIFAVSNEDATQIETMEYRPVAGRFTALLTAWAQFERDVAEFKPAEVKAEAVGKTIAALPSLSIQLVGEVKNSNLALYKATALDFVRSINTDLQTDQHFADAENVIKFCDKAEKELEVVKKAALGQTASIDELFRTVDDLKDAMRAKRLELEKLVKARKESIRVEIVAAANVALGEFAKEQQSRLSGRVLAPATRANFAEAIKGKKTISGLREGIDAEMARAKIELVSGADKLLLSLAAFDAAVGDYDFLFRDLQTLVQQGAEAVTAIVRKRIDDHKQAEEVKRKAEQERIERETRERVEREEREKIAAEERAKAQAEAKAQAVIQTTAFAKHDPKLPEKTEQTASANTAKKKVARPSDDQIIGVLATMFGADAKEVIGWLFDIDFAALESQKESA